MKQIFAWLFAAIFFAAGCAHSPELAEPVRGTGYEDADGLVIVAACPPATRTDIEEGKSTWEAGDRITVVYDGAAYEYTAAEAGPTTAFTSEAGIADYDASKPLTAYYPATTAEGVVAVEAERTIALDAESQSNPARAPLVGLPTSGNLAEGALEVTFRNIFSVIELRIDAGELASAAQSLTVEADLLTAPENPAVRYTYKCSGTATGSSYQHATVMQTMRFENAVTDGEVKIRCRAVGPYTCAGGTQNITATNAASSIPPYGFTGSYVQNFGTATPRDTKKVLCLGNSFSYYSNPAWMLKEIAWREGHALNIKAHFKGSQTLTQHLSLGFSTDVIEQGGYDFAFLQDQSQNPANYGRDATASILTGLTTLADKVRAASPSCKVILEETWTFSSASYGGFTDFPTFETYNDAGAKAMAKAAGTWVSPIGPAFRQVREGGSGINLYYSDSKHQSEYGAYLKACVNYLVLFGERFGADPADCGLNPDKAAYLRSVAEQIVLGNEGDYFIER